MRIPLLATLVATAWIASCKPPGEPDPPPVTPQTSAAIGAQPTPDPTPRTDTDLPDAPKPVDAHSPLVAEAVVLAEWDKAENKKECAPLSFNSTGPVRGAPRAATFSGGWAVAFDLPKMRSAFGVAGTGVLGNDAFPGDAERAALLKQWPYFRELARLPQPAFAGYGLEGAGAYPPENPSGRGVNSLAYVRVGKQRCLYNVWSRLGRSHLESLLDALRRVPI